MPNRFGSVCQHPRIFAGVLLNLESLLDEVCAPTSIGSGCRIHVFGCKGMCASFVWTVRQKPVEDVSLSDKTTENTCSLCSIDIQHAHSLCAVHSNVTFKGPLYLSKDRSEDI